MIAYLLSYLKRRRHLNEISADFFRGGMHCELVPKGACSKRWDR